MHRRLLFLLIALVVACALTALLASTLAPIGWTAWKLVALAAFAGTSPWTGICAANALLGTAILTGARDPVAVACPPTNGPRIRRDALEGAGRVAIAVAIRDEDIGAVLAALSRLLRGLDSTGAGAAFTAFILSDTSDPARVALERAAVAHLATSGADAGRVCYRHRARNDGFKAGNIMEFLDNHAAGFDLMLTLDADSEMSAGAVLRLFRTLSADPTLALVQHLTVGRPSDSAFTRLFQFGMRSGMRVWATGQGWWQGAEGPYWGHNALIRIAPFRAHARLPALPGGRTILSHDQVEAALLAGAGWGVRVLPIEDGSTEANPPALPEFIRREQRWLAGNLQYATLLRLPGLRPMGRWQLIQAMLMFAGAPLYVLFAIACAGGAVLAPETAISPAAAATLTVAWLACLYAPKLGGYLQVLADPAERIRYGGAARFASGAAAELAFTLLLDPIMLVAKTAGFLRLLGAFGAGWPAQNRAERRIAWAEATRLLWPQTALGVLLLAAFAMAGWRSALCATPLLAGLPLAIPLCVWSSDPRLGRWLRARGICATPEEAAPVNPPRPRGAAAAAPAAPAAATR